MKTTVVLLVLGLCLAACGDEPSTVADAFPVPSWAKVAPEQIAEAKKHGVPVAFENELGMRFVLIPAGTFLMGSPVTEEGRYHTETQHKATISRPFYMQITEVTNQQFRRFQPDHRTGEYKGRTLDDPIQPVAKVQWAAARSYAEWTASRDPERSYALPDQASWEYACRAGTNSRYWWGDDPQVFVRYANVADERFSGLANAEQIESGDFFAGDDGHAVAAPVASFQPNRWGLYDMLGNVWEWCSDHPIPGQQGRRVTRGGSWYYGRSLTRCAVHAWMAEDMTFDNLGFRLVSPMPEKAK